MPHAARTLAPALAFVALSLIAPSVFAQASALPGIVDEDTIERLEGSVLPAIAPVRVREDLGPRARPRFLDGTGVAARVRLADGAEPIWLTAHAFVANAAEIEIRIDGVWHAAERAHATPFFDLAALDAPAPADVTPLELASTDDVALALFVAVVLDPESDPVLAATALTPIERGGLEYYGRSLSAARNGSPIVDDEGRLVALSSFTAPDRAGGTLAIRAAQVAEWYEAWDRITDDPLGWSPRVQTEGMPLTTGEDALGP